MQKELYNIDTALLTQRCVVRRFRENEGELFFNLVRSNHDYLYDNFHLLIDKVSVDKESAESYIRHRIAAWLLQQDYAFGIWSNESSDLIGYIHIMNLEWEIPLGEIAFFLDRDFVNQGIMTEVVARVVRFGFLQLKLEKIILQTLSDNYASQRLARRTGFSREGELRNEYRKPAGNLADVYRFGITREAYGE